MTFNVNCFYKYKGEPYRSYYLVTDKVYKCKGYQHRNNHDYLILEDDRGNVYEEFIPHGDTSFTKSGINPNNWIKRNKAVEIKSLQESVKEDKVNHPSHYTWLKDLCGIEVIDITRHMDFDLGNAIKYILRCGHKSEQGYTDKEKTIEDLRKAVFYINDKINQLQKI